MRNKFHSKNYLICASSFLLAGSIFFGCTHFGKGVETDSTEFADAATKTEDKGNRFEAGNTVKTRYEVPPGYYRVETEKGSFAEYLQNLPLQPEGYPTHLFDGTEKDENVATSVIALDVDSVDLQHSAGAIIRLRAEYLYSTGQYDKIHFKLKNGLDCNYSEWAQGFRVAASKGQLRWTKESDKEDYTYETFREYLRTVFRYTDEKTLAREMKDATPEEFGIGTIFFNSRPPYNVAIVVDMIEQDPAIKKPYYETHAVLLAQGGSPTQEIEIIKGNSDDLGLFRENPIKMHFGYIWTTPNKGERPMAQQGGRLLTYDKKFIEKQLKIFFK